MLHSFGLRFKPWTDYAQFIRSGITSKSQSPVDFHDHSLLNARLNDDKADAPFVDYLHAIYADSPPDLILAIGAPAANFVQRYRKQIFPGTPMLFTAVEARRVQYDKLTHDDAVVAVAHDFPASFENILRVLPRTKLIAVVNGASPNETFWLGELRREILAKHPAGEERKALLHRIAKRKILQPARQSGGSEAKGAKVFLVGAGPGDPDLLTVKAQRLIQTADVILHDDLVTPEILALASPDAEIVNVGKRCGMKNITQEEINSLLVSYAADYRVVVRLKSGDPLIFGRAAEEMTALGEADVQFEVVPGITAAFAAAAAIPCSLTDRGAASNVVFSTGHHAQSHNEAAIPELEDATRIVYMPGRDLSLLALEWLQEGLPSELPCAIVSHAGRPEQQVTHTTLGSLGRTEAVQAPSILLAGWALEKPVQAAIKTQQGVEKTTRR